MTNKDVEAALKALGWSWGELARRLGLHRNAVSKWRTGKVAVPGYAAAYLNLALKVKRLAEEIL